MAFELAGMECCVDYQQWWLIRRGTGEGARSAIEHSVSFGFGLYKVRYCAEVCSTGAVWSEGRMYLHVYMCLQRSP